MCGNRKNALSKHVCAAVPIKLQNERRFKILSVAWCGKITRVAGYGVNKIQEAVDIAALVDYPLPCGAVMRKRSEGPDDADFRAFRR